MGFVPLRIESLHAVTPKLNFQEVGRCPEMHRMYR